MITLYDAPAVKATISTPPIVCPAAPYGGYGGSFFLNGLPGAEPADITSGKTSYIGHTYFAYAAQGYTV